MNADYIRKSDSVLSNFADDYYLTRVESELSLTKRLMTEDRGCKYELCRIEDVKIETHESRYSDGIRIVFHENLKDDVEHFIDLVISDFGNFISEPY